MQLKARLGEAAARDSFLDVIGQARRSKLAGSAYIDLFDGNKSTIYFTDLTKVISKEWSCFENVLGPDKDGLLRNLRSLNDLRVDAHAKELTEAEFAVFRLAAEELEGVLSGFLD